MILLDNTENKAMTLTTTLLIIILLMLAVLIWAIQRIQLQNKALLQSERDVAQIRNDMLERE